VSDSRNDDSKDGRPHKDRDRDARKPAHGRLRNGNPPDRGRRAGGKRFGPRDGAGDGRGHSDERRSGGGDTRKPYGDRDGKKPYGDRDRKPYGDRDGKKPYGDRDRKPYGDRDGKKPYGDRDRKPYGDRAGKRPSGDRNARRPSGDRERDSSAIQRPVRPLHDDPPVPERIEAKDLDRVARIQLKTLSKENADRVARHLAAAAEVLEEDPELAHRHALSAARTAGRIAVVRESLAITAYAIGDFALALRELRTYRRISGNNDQLPLMVDSERGVGRPDRALELGRSVDRDTLPVRVRVALAIAMSGARLDLGQPEEALGELEIQQLDPDIAFDYSPALFAAYAEVLGDLGRDADAALWREHARRAENALGSPAADDEMVTVYELEEDGSPASTPQAGTQASEEEMSGSPAEREEEGDGPVSDDP
jgi:23S rRNA pseudouridine2605 synthase